MSGHVEGVTTAHLSPRDSDQTGSLNLMPHTHTHARTLAIPLLSSGVPADPAWTKDVRSYYMTYKTPRSCEQRDATSWGCTSVAITARAGNMPVGEPSKGTTTCWQREQCLTHRFSGHSFRRRGSFKYRSGVAQYQIDSIDQLKGAH